MIQLDSRSLPLEGGCVLTLGNFDGVHTGHTALIKATVRRARSVNLPAAVWTFRQHPQSFFSAEPPKYLTNAEEKAELIEKAGADLYFCADFADCKDMEPEAFVEDVLIKGFRVREVFCGYNFSFGKGGVGTPELLGKLLSEHEVPLTVIPPVCSGGEAVSSTRVRALIAEGNIEEANRLLGRRYGFCLPVVHGRQLGRLLGSPTVNQILPEDAAVPRFGVYAAVCEADGLLRGGVANIGVSPTVSEKEAVPACETYIFDYKGDLYGHRVRVGLIGRIRDEKRFGSLAELSAQISEDIKAARAVTEKALAEGETDV